MSELEVWLPFRNTPRKQKALSYDEIKYDSEKKARGEFEPNPDSETEALLQYGYSEHLQGACLHAAVPIINSLDNSGTSDEPSSNSTAENYDGHASPALSSRGRDG